MSGGQSGEVVSSEEGQVVGSEGSSAAKTEEVLGRSVDKRQGEQATCDAVRTQQKWQVERSRNAVSQLSRRREGGADRLSFHSRARGALS